MQTNTFLISTLALLGFSIVVFRVFVRRDYRRLGRLSPFSTLLEWVVFFSWGFYTWFDLPSVFRGRDANAVGWVLIAIGMPALFALIAYLGFLRSNGLEVDVLKRAGPYRWSRNPQVVACFLAVAGYALLWPTWHTLVWALLFAAMAHLMVLEEERLLGNVFGEEYAAYRAKVRRYV